MIYQQLLNRAYGLCVQLNNQAIAHDLVYMTEIELIGIINFLTQLQGN